jgi:hypothetical protein
MKYVVSAILLTLVFAQQGLAQLVVEDGYIRGLPPGQKVTAAFMTLRNPGAQDVILTSASSPVAEKLEFHQHSHEGGMMRMREVEQLLVPAAGELRLSPGNLHLMLFGLRQVLREGDTVALELCAADAACQTIELPVVSVLNE